MSELNLIPQHIKQKRILRYTLIQASIIILLVAVLLGVAGYVPYASLKKLTTKEAELKASLETSQAIKSENEKLKKETASYKEYIALIEKLQKSKTTVYPIFKNLEKYIPKDVVITNLSFNSGTVNINATCKVYDSTDEFLANLHESKEFAKSNIPTITKNDKTGECTFTLTINLKGEVK